MTDSPSAHVSTNGSAVTRLFTQATGLDYTESGRALLSLGERHIIAARMLDQVTRGFHGNQHRTLNGSAPPTQAQIAGLLEVSVSAIQRAQRVIRADVPGMVTAVESGRLTVTSADRILHDVPALEQQRAIVAKINNGAPPRTVIPHTDTQEARDSRRTFQVTVRLPNQAVVRERYRYIQREALTALRDQLNAVEVLLRDAEGLRPDIDANEAAGWAEDLSKARRHLTPLITLLKERATS